MLAWALGTSCLVLGSGQSESRPEPSLVCKPISKESCQGLDHVHSTEGQPLAQDTQSLLGKGLFPVQLPMAATHWSAQQAWGTCTGQAEGWGRLFDVNIFQK